jgi:tryptophan 2,3-dioxygenase
MADIHDKIKKKYEALGEKPETYLKGLLHAKPINYWDYIEVETLLSLQRPRTDFKDEAIFIMYHQVTELFLKMLLHEAKQLQEAATVIEDVWMEKIGRMCRYTKMLIGSFDIMKDGMSYEDYNVFRDTLTPASGFQSVQFRYVELHCTGLGNLVNTEGKKRLPNLPSTEDYFKELYWKDAGHNRKTGKKTMTLRQFEEKYQVDLIHLANKLKGKTLNDAFERLTNPSEALKTQLLKFDRLYNVDWPMVHLNTAKHYLDKKGENKTATGGSEWKKYLHPKFQQRTFFPSLWEEE